MAVSLFHGKRVTLEHVGPIADGVAVKAVGEETFRLCREHVDGIVMVNRDAICASIKVGTMNHTFICMLFLTFFKKMANDEYYYIFILSSLLKIKVQLFMKGVNRWLVCCVMVLICPNH
jgi:hypothetical protein